MNKPTKPKSITRSDLCYLVGKRAGGMNTNQSAAAWSHLAQSIYNMGFNEPGKMPKFNDLIRAIRKATITAKNSSTYKPASPSNAGTSALDSLLAYRGPIMFWACPKGCDDCVSWEKVDEVKKSPYVATCSKCGEKSKLITPQ